ncbi:MAG: copper ion binding protein, partial [Desulfobacteria bacterium]
MERDLVCGMDVDRETAAAKIEYQGKTYFFCAESCKEKFEKDSEKYINEADRLQVVEKVEETVENEEVSARADLERLDLPIQGMSCASCVAKIEKGLSQLDGVADAKVNFATEKAAITFDSNEVQMQDFIRTVRELGYEAGLEKVTLPVQGMSCASCVEKVQKALSQVPGVIQADVNFATEKATVKYIPGQATVRDMSEAVEAIGYKILEVDEGDAVEKEKAAREAQFRALRQKFVAGVILVVPLFILVHWDKLGLSQIWALGKQTSFFVQLILQTPVQFWVGWQFYKGAWGAARRKTSDMNTLIAVGTSAAYLYSVLATFFPWLFAAKGLLPEVYFDTAGAIIVLILLGRLLEARAKGQTSEAIKKLIGLQAKTAMVVRENQEV